ncbi:MAG: alpha/beta fold hydrolase [Caldilineae bacterium]|nr:alpha/beta fold hydrolase [Anaerolineae bacterium]MCB9153582.1 alpha/beta fold hydrolase [Caldilineae bacterium]
MRTLPLILPDGLPFLLTGGPTCCILFHGFTAMPGEMRWLGDDLHSRGYTVLGVRLAGHGTHPEDLARTRWTDWMVDVEDALALVDNISDRVVLIGQSMGGVVALLGAGKYPAHVAGVVAIATPFSVTLPSRDDLRGVPADAIEHKGRPTHREYGLRREAVYPAYAAEPPHILPELGLLIQEMQTALPEVQAPTLLIHSRDDFAVPVENMARLYETLGTTHKDMCVLDTIGHSVVRDPRRRPVFDVIGRFVRSVADSTQFCLTEAANQE